MPLSQVVSVGVIVVIALAAVWGVTALVMLIMNQVSGWGRLAAAFPAKAPMQKAVGGLGSATFHTMCNYNGCILWKADEECLHLRLLPVFSMFHEPMSLPWAAVEIVGERTRFGVAKLRVLGVPIKVPGRMVDREVSLREELKNLEQQ